MCIGSTERIVLLWGLPAPIMAGYFVLSTYVMMLGRIVCFAQGYQSDYKRIHVRVVEQCLLIRKLV